ncbi:MAG: phosphopyruvate hydratase [Candidatus Heimdallarchaeota archaeon]|nr:phosphopyruvate hydratase [Candidatus Heimdallarchaeota archaeon]
MSTIEKVRAREILDSRGNPTVEVEVSTSNQTGRFIVPSGASTGQFEAVELRDKGKRFHGKGVMNAVNNIRNIIAPKVIGYDIFDQEGLDRLMIELDGTSNKGNLGANAILGVSIANVRAAAKERKQWDFEYIGEGKQLPCPMLNVINGGKHAGGDLAIQEFMLMPIGFDKFSEALRASAEVYQQLKKFLKKNYGGIAVNVGDEGGFAPPINSSRQALDALIASIEEAGYKPLEQFHIGIDAAASEFLIDGKYNIDGKQLTPEEFSQYYYELIEEYPILLSLEDPFDEKDFDAFASLVSKFGSSRAVVGDDLTVTNVERIKTAIDKQSMNYLLLKVNQIGSFTEAKEAFALTKSQDWGVVISHRSGETEDVFIADLAVGWGAERIKTGAPARSERVAKYNQLLRIEEYLGDDATYYNKI